MMSVVRCSHDPELATEFLICMHRITTEKHSQEKEIQMYGACILCRESFARFDIFEINLPGHLQHPEESHSLNKARSVTLLPLLFLMTFLIAQQFLS